MFFSLYCLKNDYNPFFRDESKKIMTELNHTDRYSRQISFSGIGIAGQKCIAKSSVTIIGIGALGTVLAETMVRSGVGHVRLVDRDYIEISNLQRQVLFDEEDIQNHLPKAQAAAIKLRKINSTIHIEPFVADVNHETIDEFIGGADLILDGTDNLHTRYLINDVAMRDNIPWIYGAATGGSGMMMVVKPNGKPCLRCLFDTPPDPGTMETCETAGVIGPLVSLIASYQSIEALKILSGNIDKTNENLVTFEPWHNRIYQMKLDKLIDGCICCRDGQYDFLVGKGALRTVSLCGRDAVQIRVRRDDKGKKKLDLDEIEHRLRLSGRVERSAFMLRFKIETYDITIFPDCRVIIKGTEDPDIARTLYAKYIGH